MNQQELLTWMQSHVAKAANINMEAVDISRSISSYGLDSSALMTMAADLEDALEVDIEIDQQALHDHPSILGLANHLSQIMLNTDSNPA